MLLVGIGLLIRRRRLFQDWPLWIAAVYLTVVHLVAHVEGRYTLPARAPLFIYAAVGVCAAGSWIRSHWDSAPPVPALARGFSRSAADATQRAGAGEQSRQPPRASSS